MLIRSLIKREGGSVIDIGGTEYEFVPDKDGDHVCEVQDEAHIARFLSITEGFVEVGTPKGKAKVRYRAARYEGKAK